MSMSRSIPSCTRTRQLLIRLVKASPDSCGSITRATELSTAQFGTPEEPVSYASVPTLFRICGKGAFGVLNGREFQRRL
jgi:hypothetical protein